MIFYVFKLIILQFMNLYLFYVNSMVFDYTIQEMRTLIYREKIDFED